MPGPLTSRLTCACLAAVLGLGGCGNARNPVAHPENVASPTGERPLSFSTVGIALLAPRNWSVATPHGSLITTVSSGPAVVALWRYPRQMPPPAAAAELAVAKRRLIAAARARDPSLQLIRSAAVRIDGHPGLELDALERVSGQLRRVRSVHVFVAREEVVLDAYAPPDIFHAVDHAVFSPLRRSLRLSAPARA